MSRRNRAIKRECGMDARYNSVLVQQLINVVLKCGKKEVATRIVYKALEKVSEELQKGDAVEAMQVALGNVRPRVEVRSRRVGGATLQVPMDISYERQVAISLRWLVKHANSQNGPMFDALAKSIVSAYNNTGDLVKKKEELHKMALSNRAYAHFRW